MGDPFLIISHHNCNAVLPSNHCSSEWLWLMVYGVAVEKPHFNIFNPNS